jgi:endonuclease/exonuclease/phosphatase (EEP) superfamily protein YafD
VGRYWVVLRSCAIWVAYAAALGLFAVALARPLGAVEIRFDAVAEAAAPAFFVALAGTALALVLRLFAPAAALAASALALVAALWGAWFPNPRAVEPHAPELRVYFANTLKTNHDYARVAASARAADPQVIALVDFSREAEAEFDRLFADFPHRADASSPNSAGGGPRGVLIYSKFPLERRVFNPRTLDRQAFLAYRAASRAEREQSGTFAFSDVTVAGPFGPVRLMASHTGKGWPFAPADRQVLQLARLAREVNSAPSERLILVGDFNATPASRAMSGFVRQTDLKAAGTFPGTWPAKIPAFLRVGIDNALVGPDLEIVERRLGQPTGSNHSPVVIDVAPVRR